MADETPPVSPPPPPAPTPVNPAPSQPVAVPAAPEEGASNGEVLDAVKALTEAVAKIANHDAGLTDDVTPVKRPWTHWGS